MPRSDDDEVIEVRDVLDLPPSVKASLSAWGSRSSFHSFRVDSNDRYDQCDHNDHLIHSLTGCCTAL